MFFLDITQKKTAENFCIRGYVKNNDDGTVEAVACGKKDKVHKFVEWCKKGPNAAKVNNVYLIEIIPEKEFDEFTIAY